MSSVDGCVTCHRFVTHALIAWQISEVVDVERMKGFEDAVMRVVNKHIQLGSCENNG